MSDGKWNIIFNNWNNRKQTVKIVQAVFLCSSILTSILSIFGFLTRSDFRFFSLPYAILFWSLFVVFQFYQNQYFLLIFIYSMVIGFPIWVYVKQDPSVIAYISILLVITAGVITKFRYTSAIFVFVLVHLIILVFLDLFNVYYNQDLSYSLAISALLYVPLLTIGYIVAFYVNKILMNSLKSQRTQYELLKQTQKQLINQEKFESIRLLAGGIAHDFNNLLTVILGNINLLRLDLLRYPESLELIEEVENAAIQARDLTKELLTFSKETIHFSDVVNLSDILRKSTKFASSGSKTKTIVKISQDLWDVQGNPTQLAQVFQNLILNARQAMQDQPNGGIIQVIAENFHKNSLLNSERYVSIKVIDSGKGIHPEEIPKIFTPYFSTKIGSHGLGLAICHTIIQNHNGTISVKSDPGKETQFEVKLPAFSEERKNPRGKEYGDILVLEDDIYIIRQLEKNLSKLGFRLDFASNCEQVKLMLEKSVQNNHPYKILIVDSSIPNDVELCEKTKILKKIHDKLKIVLSSDNAVQPIIMNYKSQGYDAFLPKPYQIRDIRNLIQSLIVA